jgi:membrane fusion protein (multidrug efflux system)
MKNFARTLTAFCLILSCIVIFGCNKHKKQDAASAAAAQTTAVSVVKAVSQPLEVKYESSGSLEPITNPTIKAEINGRVLQVNAYAGQEVKANQILAVLDHSKEKIAYEQAKAQLASAKAELHAKELEAQSKKILMEKGIASKLSYAQAAAAVDVAKARINEMEQNLLQAEYQLTKTIIRSPIDGHVQEVKISQGDYVYLNEGTPMFKLINRSLLQARLPFSQKLAGQFQIGQKVHLFSPATPGKEYIGQVTAITPSIDPLNRSLDVIVTFDSDELWHAGASIRGHVFLEKKVDAIIVPIESIVLRNNQNYVFTVVDGKAVQHAVNIIEEDTHNGVAAVSSDFKSGAELVVHGAQYLSQGSPVTVHNA